MAPLTAVTDHWNFLGYLPFIGMVLGKDNNGRQLITRIMEAVIIALLAGYISGKITLAVMEVRLGAVENQVSKIYDDIYRPSIGE
ncbi:MAG: hypothetical protein V3R78_10215 [Thermodesulfobacteriota bacterium]